MPRKYLDPAAIPRTPFVPALEHLTAAAASLPSEVDFSDLCIIRDQSTEGSCTGFGETGQLEVARAVAGLPKVVLSPQFLYYLEGLKEGHPGQDQGAAPTDGLAILQQIGVAPEGLDPYVAGQITAPSQQAMAAAKDYRIASWSPVARLASTDPRTALLPVLQLLAQRRPLNIAILVHQSFESAQGGVIPMPGNGATDPLLGGHDMYLVGYKDDPSFPGGGYVKACNSWSAAWGDGGFALIPYAYAYDGPLTLGLWEITLPAAPAPVPPKPTPPATLRIYVSGSERPYAASLLANGTYAAPVVLLARDLGWSATRSVEGVYITKPKAGLLARLFGGH